MDVFIREVRRPAGEQYLPESIYYLCLGKCKINSDRSVCCPEIITKSNFYELHFVIETILLFTFLVMQSNRKFGRLILSKESWINDCQS